jgi:hypothetical protein
MIKSWWFISEQQEMNTLTKQKKDIGCSWHAENIIFLSELVQKLFAATKTRETHVVSMSFSFCGTLWGTLCIWLLRKCLGRFMWILITLIFVNKFANHCKFKFRKINFSTSCFVFIAKKIIVTLKKECGLAVLTIKKLW